MFAVSPSSKELDLHATPMKINVQDVTLCLMEHNLFYKASVWSYSRNWANRMFAKHIPSKPLIAHSQPRGLLGAENPSN